jgi:hypothetical protein
MNSLPILSQMTILELSTLGSGLHFAQRQYRPQFPCLSKFGPAA